MPRPARKPPERVVAIKGNYQPDTITQSQLVRGAELQAAAWLAEKDAREYVQGIELRIKQGAGIEPGEMTFDRRLQMARRRRKEGSA